MWKDGQLVWLEIDPSLGPLRITSTAQASTIGVKILATGERRLYAKKNPPFRRASFHIGQKLKMAGVENDCQILQIEVIQDLFIFKTGAGIFSEADVENFVDDDDLPSLLRQRKFSSLATFRLRKRAWELLEVRAENPLRGAVGCRVQLLAHQLWIVDKLLRQPQMRALLADEVGLGKTIEAGLLCSALHARGELKRVLILVPAALKVQWLTESFRRFNLRFRLDHDDLIEDDEFRDFVIASFDELDKNLEPCDLLIVDEAHRLLHDELRRPVLDALAKASTHVLFLSATPTVYGRAHFAGMLEVLGGTRNGSVRPLIFRSQRSELGLPTNRRLEAAFTDDKDEWIREFVGQKLNEREKVFLICTTAVSARRLFNRLKAEFGARFALFHEDMDLIERDRQAAYFADPEGAPILISSEIGGEGRNFQFCHHMVLADLPADPLVVEQRIGRLDRLGQTAIVHLWCPVTPEDDATFLKLRDEFEVFRRPWSGPGLDDRLPDLARDSGGSVEIAREVYDPQIAQSLLNSAIAFTQTPVRDFLEMLYEVFGVEVEDFDQHGLKVAASSLMFVESFPGLPADTERVLTFDRTMALSREDLSFFSVDHPDFVESIEFFLNTNHGRLAVGIGEKGIIGLVKTADGASPKLVGGPEAQLATAAETTRGWTASNGWMIGATALLAALIARTKNLESVVILT